MAKVVARSKWDHTGEALVAMVRARKVPLVNTFTDCAVFIPLPFLGLVGG